MGNAVNIGTSAHDRLLDAFERKGGLLTRSDIAALGFGSDALSSAMASGAVVRAAHGLYRLAAVLPFGTSAFAQACLAIPSGVIALETALAYHGLTTQITEVVQVAVPRIVVRKLMEIPLKIVAMPVTRFASSIQRERTFQGDRFRIFDPERTVCDCFAYPRVVPEIIAYEGLKTYLSSSVALPAKLMQEAKLTRTLDTIAPVIKALSA